MRKLIINILIFLLKNAQNKRLPTNDFLLEQWAIDNNVELPVVIILEENVKI